MQLRDKDLNLLVIFSSIWNERKLSEAAKKLSLSQPAVSHALGRLREQFADPLFVKSSSGMTPTQFAATIAPDILRLVDQLEGLYYHDRNFNPKDCEQTLYLATGDYFATTMLEKFISKLKSMAPNVDVVIFRDLEVFSPVKFERGEIHLSVTGFKLPSKEGFISEKIIDDEIACCLSRKALIGKKKLSMKEYLKFNHLFVSVVGKKVGIIDQYLKSIGKSRNVTTVVPTFFEAGILLENTELVLSGPKGLCQHLSKRHDLITLPAPFDEIRFPIMMQWHRRTDADPFQIWTRNLIKSVALEVFNN